MIRDFRSLPRVARYTWARQWPADLLVGIGMGILTLSPFVVKRSLGAGGAAVPLVVALWQAFWILAPALGPLLARVHPQRAWRWIALLANLPLLAVAFVAVVPEGPKGHGTGDLVLFIGALAVHYAVAIAYIPHRGAMLRTNYPVEVRGRMYGMLTVVSIGGLVAANKCGAWLLDQDPRWLRVLFPLAAVAGFLGVRRFGRIRWRSQARTLRTAARAPLREEVRRAPGAMLGVLRRDRAFLVYETAFMLYGFGFLMSWPLLVLFAEQELGLSYAQYSWAQGVAFPVAQVLGMWLGGRLADRFGVVLLTRAAFVTLAVFTFVVPFAAGAWSFVATYLLFGLAMGGVSIGWSLGPLHYARDGDAHMYIAVHFSLVGIRSVIAPFLGFAMIAWFSFRTGFWVATAALLVAAAVVPARRRVS